MRLSMACGSRHLLMLIAKSALTMLPCTALLQLLPTALNATTCTAAELMMVMPRATAAMWRCVGVDGMCSRKRSSSCRYLDATPDSTPPSARMEQQE